VQQLERFGGTSLGLLRERCAQVLAGEAGLAHLVHLCERRQATDKLLPCHLAEGGKVEMPKTQVPPPCFVVGAHREADRACQLDVERVQSPSPAGNLGQ